MIFILNSVNPCPFSVWRVLFKMVSDAQTGQNLPTGRIYAGKTAGLNTFQHHEEDAYFIGSGEIESGNKLILQNRLKRAGKRWNTATAQAVLTLKTKAESCIWFRDVEQPFLARCLSNSLTF